MLLPSHAGPLPRGLPAAAPPAPHTLVPQTHPQRRPALGRMFVPTASLRGARCQDLYAQRPSHRHPQMPGDGRPRWPPAPSRGPSLAAAPRARTPLGAPKPAAVEAQGGASSHRRAAADAPLAPDRGCGPGRTSAAGRESAARRRPTLPSLRGSGGASDQRRAQPRTAAHSALGKGTPGGLREAGAGPRGCQRRAAGPMWGVAAPGGAAAGPPRPPRPRRPSPAAWPPPRPRRGSPRRSRASPSRSPGPGACPRPSPGSCGSLGGRRPRCPSGDVAARGAGRGASTG